MQLLGLTGDIACGKSSVARLLEVKGAATLDSDLLVRELYAHPDFASRIASLFDAPIRDENGAIDRAKLGALVFNDAAQLHKLESLVHPAVAALRREKLRDLETAGQKIVVIEAVKLLESGQGRECDVVWCVICSLDVQMRRLKENRNLSETQARARLENQPSREAKLALAGQVPLVWIENNGTMDELAAQVERHWTQFLA
jgi:dephospho-CoA kinase